MEERQLEGKVIMVTGVSGVLAMHLIKHWQGRGGGGYFGKKYSSGTAPGV